MKMTPTDRWIRDETAKLKICQTMYPMLWESCKIDEDNLEWYAVWGLSTPDRSRMLKKINIKESAQVCYSMLTVEPKYCDYEELLTVYQYLDQSRAKKIAASKFLEDRNKRL